MKKTIGIVAHVDAGKTTLSEQILYHTNAIKSIGRVDHKNAYMDSHEIEKDRGITIFSDIATFDYKNCTYYLVDTPGHIDFSPEMERTIGIMDYAIIVISAVEGIQGHTETLWKLLKKNEVPTFIFINKIDRESADVESVMNDIKRKFSYDAILIDSDVGKISDEVFGFIGERDEKILEQYLEERYEYDTLKSAMKDLITHRKMIPCFKGAALLDIGVKLFIEWFNELTIIEYNEKEKFQGRVFKVKYDNGDRITFIKALRGHLKVKDEISYAYKNDIMCEKINSIRIYRGSKYESVDEVFAGDVFGVIGLNNMVSGQGIEIDDIQAYDMVPTLKVKAIYGKSINPKEMLGYFKVLESEDCSLNLTWDEELKEIQLSIMGKIQIEILKELIKNRFNVEVEFGQPEVLYRETIEDLAFGCGHFEPLKHYAEVHLKLEKGESGSGITFENTCHADNLTKGHQNLIKTHLFEKEHKGILIGSPITDMKITLITGRAHNKHTEGGDFREATKRALRQGLEQCNNILLEPYYEFSIEVDLNVMGKVLMDIQMMKGTFEQPIITGDKVSIKGIGPVATFMNYSLEFQALTKGKGSLSMCFDGYHRCHNEDEVIKQKAYDKNTDKQYTSASIFCSKGQGYVVKGSEAREYMHCLLELDKL